MRSLFGLFSFLLLVSTAPAMADDKPPIVGTRRLVSVMYEDQSTRTQTPVFGQKPNGYQIVTADGLWLALVTADGRTPPKSEAERAQAFTSMLAYSGHYRLEGNKLTTKVDVAWNEGMVGSEQVRYLRVEGDRMYVESPFMPNPNGSDSKVRAIVTWERAK